MLKETRILFATLVASLLLSVAMPTQALDRDDRKCEQRIHRAEDNLRQAERRHGEHSRQAQQRRRQLEEARERCRHNDRDHDHR